MTRKAGRIALLIALAVVGGGAGLLLLLGWLKPEPTAFGWPAYMTIIAGDGVRGDADGDAPRARFSDPFAVALDAEGVLYVADAGDTGRIRRIDPDGRTTTLPGRFDTPSGLALDRAGNLIVADTGTNTIRRISPAGVVTTLAGDGTAGFRDGPAAQARFDGPIGVAVDKDGTIYVADTYNDRIRRITADGQVSTLAGGAAPGFADGRGVEAAFDTPCGLVLDRDGALIVADTGNDAIRKVGKDGLVSTIARSAPEDGAGPLKAPVGLAATWDGSSTSRPSTEAASSRSHPPASCASSPGAIPPSPRTWASASPPRPAWRWIGTAGSMSRTRRAMRCSGSNRSASRARRRRPTWQRLRPLWSAPRASRGRWRRKAAGTRWWARSARCAATMPARAATTSTPVSISGRRSASRCGRSRTSGSSIRYRRSTWTGWPRVCGSTP